MEDPQAARAFLLLLSHRVCGQDGNRRVPAMDKDVGVLGVDLRPGAFGTAAGLAGCEQVELGKE